MDNPNAEAKAQSIVPEMVAGGVAFGFFLAVAVAPATLTIGLNLLGGLAFWVAFQAAVDRERACRACEPCSWAEWTNEPSAGATPVVIVSEVEPVMTSHWTEFVRDARSANQTRKR